MRKEEMVNYLREQLVSISKFFDRMNLKSDQIAVPEDVELLTLDFIKPAYKWLKDIVETEFHAVLAIWNLQSENIWNNYELYGGFEDHQECKLLRGALVILRKALVSRDRPTIFKRSIINEQIKRIKNRSAKT